MPADPATLRALVAVARLALGEAERAGLLTDDLPELVVACAERWLAGDMAEAEADARELREAAGVRIRGDRAFDRPIFALRNLAVFLAAYVEDARSSAMPEEGDPTRGYCGLIIEGAWVCLMRLGEDVRAAQERVLATFASAEGLAQGGPV